ncbi:MAG: hypothetical protein MJ072_02035, partial [Clostridia bacterium]|nr:hypothetical protein [Clostridia bacterium]
MSKIPNVTVKKSKAYRTAGLVFAILTLLAIVGVVVGGVFLPYGESTIIKTFDVPAALNVMGEVFTATPIDFGAVLIDCYIILVFVAALVYVVLGIVSMFRSTTKTNGNVSVAAPFVFGIFAYSAWTLFKVMAGVSVLDETLSFNVFKYSLFAVFAIRLVYCYVTAVAKTDYSEKTGGIAPLFGILGVLTSLAVIALTLLSMLDPFSFEDLIPACELFLNATVISASSFIETIVRIVSGASIW